MEPKHVLFFTICVVNPAFQNVGMGLQKWAVDQTPLQETKAGKWKWIGVWIIGLLFQVVVVIFGSIALTIGNASTIGGFAGLGLIALAIFSRLVLKETIVRKEMYGMALIVAGTSVLGWFSHGAQAPDVNLEARRMIMFFSIYLTAVGIGIVILARNLKNYGGAILGIIGGSMNGLGLVFQKVVMNRAMELSESEGVGAIILKLLAWPYTWLMIVGGIGGVIVIQFGYKYGKAVQVVPGHASTVVIIPILAGLVILGETVPALVLASAAVVAAGVLVTTTADPGKRAH